MSFKNKVVIITGSGSGMGEATAILFAQEGANVVIVDWNEDTAKNTGEQCKKFGNGVLVIKADVSKEEDVKNVIENTIDKFVKLDVLVNNAGIVRDETLLSENIMQTYDETLNVNLRSVVQMTNFATPYLKITKGCVINTSSIASKVNKTGRAYPVYTIAKAGVDAFTRLSAVELGPYGVRVNAVNPGPVLTNIMKHAGIVDHLPDLSNLTVLGRCSDPEEIGNLILYLASDKAKSITGSTYVIDNGFGLM